MSCASCALLIELSLRRDPRCQVANVNFAAQTATVRARSPRRRFRAGRRGSATGHSRWTRWRSAACSSSARRSGWRGEKALPVAAAWLTAPVMLSGMLMHRSPALRLLELALSTPVVFGPGGEIFARPGCWRSSARPTWIR
jgi:Cu+-exporting ATPase